MTGTNGPGRLVGAGCLAFAGAVTSFIAVGATWVSGPGKSVVFPIPGSTGARLPVAAEVLSGRRAGAGGAAVTALIACVLIIAGVLARPGARRMLLAGATAMAGATAGIVVTAAVTAAGRAASLGIHAPHMRFAPVAIAIIGAVAAVAGCVLCMMRARSAPPVRMPEGAPVDG